MKNTVIIAALNHQELKQWMARLREEAVPFERHAELELAIDRKFLYLFPDLEKTKQPPSKKEKRNRIDGVLRIIVLVFAVVAIGAIAINHEAPSKSSQAKSAKEMIDAQFSAWDGSHAKLVQLVKKSMKDPSSFQHVDTRYKKMDQHIVVWMDYRGKNSFGAYDIATVKAAYDYDGNFLWIENVR